MRRRIPAICCILLACCFLPFFRTESTAQAQDNIEVYFSPGERAQSAIINRFETARSEIDVAMYIFSNQDLADALVAVHQRGVNVKVLLDGSQDERAFSLGRFLHEKGINLRVDRSHMLFPGKSQGIMHNKFAIIDSVTVITGSYNWTQAAEIQNDENLLILNNSPEVVVRYKGKFDELWERGVSYDVRQLPSPIVVSASDLQALRKNRGENAYVQGVVHDVYFSARSGTYFINFGPDRSSFTGVIFKSAANTFAGKNIDPRTYEKKNIEVFGKIIDHPKYGLEIIIEDPVQVKVLEEK